MLNAYCTLVPIDLGAHLPPQWMGEHEEELGYDNFSKFKIIGFILCPRVGHPKAGGANGYSKRHY